MTAAAVRQDLRSLAAAAAGEHATRSAVVERDSRLTYAELFDLAALDAERLERAVGAAPYVLVPRGSARGVATLVGALLGAGVPLVADPAWTEAELAAAAARAGAVALVRTGPDGALSISDAAAPDPSAGTAALAWDDEVRCGRFTSGSTGAPRCLSFTGRAVGAAAAGWRDAAGYGPHDTVLCLATLNNGLAFNAGVLPALLAGARIALHRGALLPRQVARTLTGSEATVLVAFPYAYEQLARVGLVAPPGLRLAVSAAAPIGPGVRDAWAYAGRPICDYYGLVEVGPVTFNDGMVPDSLGTALPGVRLEIVDPSTGPAGGTVLPAGTTGRVRVATASMAGDYLDAEQPRFAERCPGGALLTQDLGSLDGDGRLRLAGRVGPVVNLSGRKVDPAEVRDAALRLPGVRDAAVFATDGAGRPVLALVAEGMTSRADIVAGLQERLADYKIPQIVRVVPMLPRGSAGKPLRDRLEEIARTGTEWGAKWDAQQGAK